MGRRSRSKHSMRCNEAYCSRRFADDERLPASVCSSLWRRNIKALLIIALASSLQCVAPLSIISSTKRLERTLYNETQRTDHILATFYRTHYRRVPSPKPGDIQYSLMSSDNNEMLATVRYSQVKDFAQNWIYLRSLAVAKPDRRKGLALELLEASLLEQRTFPVYCFADPSLTSLYAKAGFRPINMSLSGVPHSLQQKYTALTRRTKTLGIEIRCFGWSHHQTQLRVLLLQHQRELARPTGTAPLVQHSNILELSTQNCTWSGKVDNGKVEQTIQDLQRNNHRVVLLWTGGSSDTTDLVRSNDKSNKTIFVLLDGTWQEAQNMFRKLPVLWSLPRLSLVASQPSAYHLRKNYGWKERFADDNLLCTAEVVAELMDQQSGHENAGRALRADLEAFFSSNLY